MRKSRRFSLSTHGAIEFLAGVAMMIAPALLSFDVASMIVSVGLGVILTGAALGLTSSNRAALSAHTQFDTAFVLATAVAALALAAAGQGVSAVVFLAAIVVVQAGLGAATRYTALDS
jgi:hypothetical protein